VRCVWAAQTEGAFIARCGEEAVIVLDIAAYYRMAGADVDLKDYLARSHRTTHVGVSRSRRCGGAAVVGDQVPAAPERDQPVGLDVPRGLLAPAGGVVEPEAFGVPARLRDRDQDSGLAIRRVSRN
jgi:hypothetical protein